MSEDFHISKLIVEFRAGHPKRFRREYRNELRFLHLMIPDCMEIDVDSLIRNLNRKSVWIIIKTASLHERVSRMGEEYRFYTVRFAPKYASLLLRFQRSLKEFYEDFVRLGLLEECVNRISDFQIEAFLSTIYRRIKILKRNISMERSKRARMCYTIIRSLDEFDLLASVFKSVGNGKFLDYSEQAANCIAENLNIFKDFYMSILFDFTVPLGILTCESERYMHSIIKFKHLSRLMN